VAGIDPGEFGRGAAAREEARIDHERAVLNEMLASGWSRATATEARRLQDAIGDAVARWMSRCGAAPCDETALGLVGEARGAAVADWFAQAQGLDDRTRRLLRECAASAAAMAMIDGFMLGQEAVRPDPRPSSASRLASAPVFSHNGSSSSTAREPVSTAR
jgi:hypothetical protein